MYNVHVHVYVHVGVLLHVHVHASLDVLQCQTLYITHTHAIMAVFGLSLYNIGCCIMYNVHVHYTCTCITIYPHPQLQLTCMHNVTCTVHWHGSDKHWNIRPGSDSRVSVSPGLSVVWGCDVDSSSCPLPLLSLLPHHCCSLPPGPQYSCPPPTGAFVYSNN